MLADYGTGAVMGVPGGDQRDWEFATSHRPADHPDDRSRPTDFDGEAYNGEGPAINSPAPGVDVAAGHQRPGGRRGQARDHRLPGGSRGAGKGTVNFRLRDWLLSRQRYWGVPIPIIHCEKDGEVAVPYDQLPLELPELRGADLKPKGVSPLAAADGLGQRRRARPAAARPSGTATRWTPSSTRRGTSCATARRDYTEARSTSRRSNAWMPADIYVGGVEHAVLHLLYARFFTKVLRDMGMLEFGEPFAAQLNQGFVINRGKKMSKSLGNGVSLGDQLAEFGVDAVRLTLVFAGPPEDDIDWADMSPGGSLRFLQRAWRLSGDVTSAVGTSPEGGDVALRRATHKTVHEAGRADRGAPVQRDGRPGHGAGERHPQGDRLRLRPRRTRPCARPPRRWRSCCRWWRRTPPRRCGSGWATSRPSPAPAGRTSTRRCWSRTSVTAVVQIQGKVRARLEVSPDISEADLEAAGPGRRRRRARRSTGVRCAR